MNLFRYITVLTFIILFSCKDSRQEETPSNESVTISDLRDIMNVLEFNDVTQSVMSENYDQQEAGFTEIQNFVHSKLNDSIGVEIEFKDENEFEIFHFKNENGVKNNWHVVRESALYDSLLQIIGWSDTDISLLYKKLNNIDCISIASYKKSKTTFGYKRDGMGKYAYLVLDSIIDTNSRERYGNCSTIFFRDNVIFEYQSGAIGSMCFPDKFKSETNNGK